MKKYQDSKKNLITRIKLLQKSHFELSEICGKMGALFTPSIVFTILFTGVELLITSYTGFKMFIGGQIMMIALWTCVKFVLIDFYRIICILQTFSQTEKEVSIGVNRWFRIRNVIIVLKNLQANSTPSYVHAILLEMEHQEAQKEVKSVKS